MRGLPTLLVAACLAASACGVSDEQEKAIGAATSAQIERELPLVTDADVTAYITALGERLARASGDAARDWRFRVVDAELVNAFAVPGGYVYINRGLIARAATLAQLAGVMGHEVAHVTLRHSAEQLEKTQKTNVGVTIVCMLTNICESEAARVAINVGGAALFARFSRADELEADSAAVHIVTRAGMDPRGVPGMFERLLEDRRQRPDVVQGWFASHPLEEDRIAALERIIAARDRAMLEGLVRDDPSYQEFRRRLAELPPSPRSKMTP